MPKLSNETVDEGMVLGHVRTSKQGSDCDFIICPVEKWELMSSEECEAAARSAMFESGVLDWWY